MPKAKKAKLGGPGQDGSTQVFPPNLDVDAFVKSRSREIKALENAIRASNDAASTRIFQTLPRALRRRAASHDARRVPKRMRPKALSEIVPGKGPKNRKTRNLPSRKRKAVKMFSRTASLQKRQRNKIWLPTHVWHAKRMHMVERWGFKIADKPTFKAFRASYRAAVGGCIVHDASYMRQVVLQGTQHDISSIFALLLDPTSHSCTSERYVKGSRVFHAALYRPGKYPFDFIGPISLIWSPSQQHSSSSSSNDARNILLIYHPSIFNQINRALHEAINITQTSIQLNHASLATFELTGPLSSAVLASILNAKGKEVDILRRSSPAEVARGMILSTTVDDPRLAFPPKISKSRKEAFANQFVQPSVDIANNKTFWKVCVDGMQPKFTKNDLDKRRSKNGACQGRLARTPKDDRVPILLFQKSLEQEYISGNEARPMHGWTLMVPLGFSLPFFHSFTSLPVAVGGLEATKQQYFESNIPNFPQDFPLTGAEKVESCRVETIAKTDWSRKPPAKRENYEKLDVLNPFRPEWIMILEGIVKDVSKADENKKEEGIQAWLLRGGMLKRLLKANVFANCGGDVENASELFKKEVEETWKKVYAKTKTQQGVDIHRQVPNLLSHALVRVSLSPLTKGVFETFALIYEPNEEQKTRLVQNIGREKSTDMLMLLKHLKEHNVDTDHNEDHNESTKGCRLIGRVSSGGYSLRTGHGYGIGSVAVKALPSLVYNRSGSNNIEYGPVLVRNINSPVARPGMLRVII